MRYCRKIQNSITSWKKKKEILTAVDQIPSQKQWLCYLIKLVSPFLDLAYDLYVATWPNSFIKLT